MPYKDIAKRRASHRKYYRNNKQLYRQKNIRRKSDLVNFVIALKQKPCMDCGVQYPHYVMDFDHRDRKTKLTSINRMINFHSYSKDKILEEIKKCDLVCSNCHRERTYCGVV